MSFVLSLVALNITFSRFAFGRYWNRCLPKCLFKDTMLLGNCKAKIKKVSAAFAIALMSARLEQTVCYRLCATHSFI